MKVILKQLLVLGVVFWLASLLNVKPVFAACLRSDVNQDGRVNLVDYSILVRDLSKPYLRQGNTDINQDGLVNLFDYTILTKDFFKISDCSVASPTPSPVIQPSPSPSPSPTPSPSPSPTPSPTPSTSISLSLQGQIRRAYQPSGGNYAYAPAVVEENGLRHMFLCQSEIGGVFRDIIYRYTTDTDGNFVSRGQVLKYSTAGWDSFHVCDPSVVAGNFTFNGQNYRYAMFYTGNDVDASAHNQIGVAFSNSITSNKWTKYSQPLISSSSEGISDSSWGVGQPSAINLNQQGKILISYTHGVVNDTYGENRIIDLSQFSPSSKPNLLSKVKISDVGITDFNSDKQDYINNQDIVFDSQSNRYLLVRHQRPLTSIYPWYIPQKMEVASMPKADFESGQGSWDRAYIIGVADTGFKRNHNAGFLRDIYGYLPSTNTVTTYVTSSCASTDCGSVIDGARAEFTYKIWQLNFQRN